MKENVRLKAKGAKWFVTADYTSLQLYKTNLGKFFFHAFKIGVQIGEIWVFNKNFDGSPVYVSVFMTEEMRIELENLLENKVKFVDPPRIVLA